MSESRSPGKKLGETFAKSGLPPISPDFVEQDFPEHLDNIVPTRGYQMLPMVGLGGSAGSIAALQRFFTAMPAQSGMVFVVILHLSPEHESTLPELLSRFTSMHVVQAQDGDEVKPNCVYVIPPGRFLASVDGHLQLTKLEPERGKRMQVDLFFRTLADTRGPHSAAIVLSGADSDGAIGIKRIKERGGLTIAQDPDEAEHSSMPRSAIDTGMVDWVLQVEQMPARLMEYRENGARLKLPPEEGPQPAKAAPPAPTEDEKALRDVLTFVRTRTGRDFSNYKRATIVRRISRRLQVNGVPTLPEYLDFLRTHPGEAGALVQDMLISVTNFFRDRECFQALEAQLPALFAGKGPAEAVRVWVPACATGEEAYSIAMMLLEHASLMETPPIIQVFATDLDEDVITTAREAFYPLTITADVSEDRLRRFFIKEHRGYRLRRDIRECVLFAVHDLLKDAPFSKLDLVSCRNLLIYLTRDAQKRAIDTFHFALRPGARLFLGASETVEEDNADFHVADKKHRIYAQVPSARVGLPVPIGPSTLQRAIEAQVRAEGGPFVHGAAFDSNIASATKQDQALDEMRAVSWEELHFKLIERFAPPSLIVTRDYDIVHVSENAGRFLHFTGGEPSMNLLRVVHPMLRIELRAALFRAAQTNMPVEVFRVPIEMDGTTLSVDIRVAPAQEIAPDYLLVVLARRENSNGEVPATPIAAEPAVRHLEREIEQMKVRLRDTVEQYEASTDELKASNEELQAMNEELRSATEELETSREELQSINEELTTVNQELKSKVDELGHTNSDLANLMSATAIATIFLDRTLHIMRYTPSAVTIFHLIASDLGRPLTDLTHRLEYPELKEDAERVLQTLIPVKREVTDGMGRWFLAQLLPYRTTEDHIGGVVLTFVDITERRAKEEELGRSRAELEAAFQQTQRARQEAEAANRTKDDFLATLSHELRTPLTPILTAAEALLKRDDLPARVRDGLQMICRNIELETHFINDLLDLTRISRGKFELMRAPGSLHDFVQAAIEIARPDIESRQQHLTVNLAAERHQLVGDAARLEQVFWNLLKNASKFTPKAGAIHVTSRNEGDSIVVEVSDTGRGIDPAAVTDIFQAFRQGDDSITREFGGLGLGLAISKATVDAQGGSIVASSEGWGRGAVFTVNLPLSTPGSKHHNA